ncbi:hypothetical protein WKI40_21510 [Kosakonia sacchari]|uniref:hypothetical protein n=1 Tax=Kosakonia sacchari TaxID=1158459 RepID=UPI0030BD209F
MSYRAYFLYLEHSAHEAGDFIDAADVEWPSEGELIEIDVNPFGRRGAFRRKVVICKDNKVVMVLRVFVGVDELGCLLEICFCRTLSNDHTVAFICGQHVHLFDIASRRTTSDFLRDYVVGMCPLPEYADTLTEDFFVTTMQNVFRVNVHTGVVWKSPQCGYDCVLVHQVADGVVYGSGDWDPPDGGRDFRLDLHTGQLLDG